MPEGVSSVKKAVVGARCPVMALEAALGHLVFIVPTIQLVHVANIEMPSRTSELAIAVSHDTRANSISIVAPTVKPRHFV